MKRSTKKYLMLIASLVVLMTVMAFGASATEQACNHALYPTYQGNIVDPTCIDNGYTEVRCGNCDEVIASLPGSEVPALGHKYNWNMIADGAGFSNKGECERCHVITTEMDGDKAVVYYSVEYRNPAAATAYDTAINYAKIVTQRAGVENAELLGTVYVKAGESATAPAGVTPICEKDIYYGQYNFIGWFDDYVLLEAEPTATLVEAVDLSSITENTVVYAGFRGVDISYNVYFKNYNGTDLAVAQGVPHGAAAIYKLDTPTRDSDVKYRYIFSYWSYKGKEVNLDHVYGSVTLEAYFQPDPKTYNLAYYYDEACTEPIINSEVVVKDSEVQYGGEATNGLAIPEELLEKAPDKQYIYEWTGNWVLVNRPTWKVNLNSFTVPHGTPDSIDGISEVRLMPEYVKQLRVYDLKVTVIYPDDNNYHPEEVNLQVTDANNAYAGAHRATKVDEYTYTYTFLVNYSPYYNVAATAVGYEAESVSNFTVAPSGVIMTMKKVQAHSCGCICHTFFKPIWVRVLRLMHTLFGLEYVCCNDMYANIGPSLNYGPGK